MTVSLLRNTRLFFTTNLSSTGAVKDTGFLPSNTFELQVLSGISVSQKTMQQNVTSANLGTPNRAKIEYTSSIEPADFYFSTYIRPSISSGIISCDEHVLWNAFAGKGGVQSTTPAWVDGSTTTPAELSFKYSNTTQLQQFGLIVVLDNITYALDNAVLNQVSIDFSIDGISTALWEGKGVVLRQLGTVTATKGTTVLLSGAISGSAKAPNTLAPFIANKLSSLQITNSSATMYNLAITTGNIVLSNNITFVNTDGILELKHPIGYYTGTRSVSGTLTTYLKTGSANSGALATELLQNINLVNSDLYSVVLHIGGINSVNRVKLEMPAVLLNTPDLSLDSAVSVNISFTAQATTLNERSLTGTNEVSLKYYSAV